MKVKSIAVEDAPPEYAQLLGIANEMRLHIGALASFLSTRKEANDIWKNRIKADLELIESRLEAAKQAIN
ncbi:hypothetical protein [Anabaena sp. CCY 9910]|uniref:hypothetical protein n=1 Tax=Anabaena sp. CCY 9910 TaxID=3103870 RepID=UPI0039E09717